jgi:AcrR family transcriptional regulator
MRNVEETAPARRIRLTAAQRRESILNAAVEVFSAAGYRAGKVSDVAALVGVSEPVIFQNFGSKAALFAAVVDRVADEVRAELERLAGQPGSGSAADLLAHALSHDHLQGHGARGPHAPGYGAPALGGHGMLFADAFALIAEPELTEPARSAARTIIDHLADLIRRGQADGELRAGLDPEAAAWLVLSVLATRAFRRAVMPGQDDLEDGVTALTFQALAEPAPGPARQGRPGGDGLRHDGLLGEPLELVRCHRVLVGVGGGEVDRSGDVADELLNRQNGGRTAGGHHPVGQELALVLR